ncbi:MAG: hypothetical protein QG604_24 [Candidatus Dependentiae bacterium]|nr:hypothetical protein [Candidatus Dependentiae bacterium]
MKKMYRLLLLTVAVFVAPCTSLQPNVRVIGGVSVAAAAALVTGRYIVANKNLAGARERLHEALRPLPVLITDGGEVAEHVAGMQAQPDYIIQKARRGVEVAQKEFDRVDKVLKGFIAIFGVGVIVLAIRHMMAPESEDASLLGTVTGGKPATKPTSDDTKPLVVTPPVIDDTKKPDEEKPDDKPGAIEPPVVVVTPPVVVVTPPVVKPLTPAEQRAADIAAREAALQAEHTRKMQEAERRRQEEYAKDEEDRRLARIADAKEEREARAAEREAERIRAEKEKPMRDFMAALDEAQRGKPSDLDQYRKLDYMKEMNALGDRRNLQEIVQKIGAMPEPERMMLRQRILAASGRGPFLSRFRAKDLKADDVEILRQLLNVVDVGPNAWMVERDRSFEPIKRFDDIAVGETQEAFDASTNVAQDFAAQIDLAVLLRSRNIAFSLKTPNGSVLCSNEGIEFDVDTMRYRSRDWSDRSNFKPDGTFRHRVIERLNQYEAAKSKLGACIASGDIEGFKAELARHPKLDIDCPVAEYQYQPLLLLAVGSDNDHHREFVTALLERGANPRIVASNNGAIFAARQAAAQHYDVRLSDDRQSDKYREYQEVREDLRVAVLAQQLV